MTDEKAHQDRTRVIFFAGKETGVEKLRPRVTRRGEISAANGRLQPHTRARGGGLRVYTEGYN